MKSVYRQVYLWTTLQYEVSWAVRDPLWLDVCRATHAVAAANVWWNSLQGFGSGHWEEETGESLWLRND